MAASTAKTARTRSPAKGASSKKGAGGPLSKKIGPLPVWGWAVGVLVAILVGMYFRNRSSSTTASPTTATTTDPSVGGTVPADGSGTDFTGQQLADQITALQAQLTGDESILAFLAGNYTPPDTSTVPWAVPAGGTWGTTPGANGAPPNVAAIAKSFTANVNASPAQAAQVKSIASEFTNHYGAPNNFAYRGSDYVSPAAPANLIASLAGKFIKGASQATMHKQALATGKAAAGAQVSAQRTSRQASALPSFHLGPSVQPSISLTSYLK